MKHIFKILRRGVMASIAVISLTGCGERLASSDAGIVSGPERSGALELFANQTHRSSSYAHGTQIEYLSPAGRAYLWYPGNHGIVVGEWKIINGAHRERMCFRYGRNAYNPVTRQSGGAWECRSLRGYLSQNDERVTGNPLDLMPGAVPFVLPPREVITIAQAQK